MLVDRNPLSTAIHGGNVELILNLTEGSPVLVCDCQIFQIFFFFNIILKFISSDTLMSHYRTKKFHLPN